MCAILVFDTLGECCLSRNSRESRNGEVEFRRKKGCRMTDPLFLVPIIRCFGRPFFLFYFPGAPVCRSFTALGLY